MKQQPLTFVKMQGAGSDFIVLDGRTQLGFELPKLARLLCDRNFGIGAQGLIVIEPSRVADFRMLYFGADGARSSNFDGMRCVGRFIAHHGLLSSESRELALEIDSGITHLHIIGKGERVRLNMGPPRFEGHEIPVREGGPQLEKTLEIDGKQLAVSAVGMGEGEAHCVVFVRDLADCNFEVLAPKLESHSFFPERANVEFAHIVHPEECKVRTWIRGEGEALSSSAGNCAVVAAGVRKGVLARKVAIDSRGGKFEVSWDEKSGMVFLIGPADEVFTGSCDVHHLTEKRLGDSSHV